MIHIKNLSVEFSGRAIFENANFIINYGDKIGLIGRNGSGKSTFLKVMLGELKPTDGAVEVPDYYRIGHLSQHIQFTKDNVLDEVCSVLESEREHEAWKGEMILGGLGFNEEQLWQDPMKFSGGYQVKINLAKILLMEPDMLLLDEPTNYLDIYSIRWLGDFLKKWKGELILITHDRQFMDNVITHTLIIHRNNFRKVQGSTGKIREQIALEEEIYEKTRVSEERKRKEVEDWIKRFGAKASKASAAKSREKALARMDEKPKLAVIESLDFRFNYTEFGSKDLMMEVEKLKFGWNEKDILINDLSFSIHEGDKICIIGKNGNGKSTLLQLLVNQIQPISGSVKMHNKSKYGYFGQMNLQRLDPKLSIAEEMSSVNPEIPQNIVRRTCSHMLFPGDLAHKKISILSGGEKSRVMLGKILLTPSNLLFLDEPTNHFDIESCESLMEAIQEFAGAVVMVTHDEYFLHEIATKLVIFDRGKTFCFYGTYAEFLEKIGWSE